MIDARSANAFLDVNQSGLPEQLCLSFFFPPLGQISCMQVQFGSSSPRKIIIVYVLLLSISNMTFLFKEHVVFFSRA